MKHWINRNYKTLIITAFLIPIVTVAIVSISHVTQWYGISNPLTWAVYLSVGIEIAAMSALAAISANMGKNVYFPFIIVTLIQFIGNIFFAYEYIDMTSKMFQSWVELVSPLVGFLGVEPTDLIGHKRFLALFAGGLLPVISLSFLHMLVKFTEEDRLKDIEDEEHHSDNEPKNTPTDPQILKDLIDDAVRVRFSEDDLAVLEKILLNPPQPNEDLVKAAEEYKEMNKVDVPDPVWERVKKLHQERVDNGETFEEEPTALANSQYREQDLDDMLDDDELYPNEDINKDDDIDEEINNIIPEPIVFKSPGIPFKDSIVDNVPHTTTKEDIEEIIRLKISENDLDRLEKFMSKKYEPNLDEPEESEEMWNYDAGDELEDELQDWDVTVADGLEDEEEFDGDPIEDYIPVEESEDEPVVGDHYPLDDEPEEESSKILTTREKIEEILDKKKT